MSIYNDPPLLRSVAEVGAMPENLLGIGGEACVFALDAERVVRIYHSHTLLEGVEARTSLLNALQPAARRLPFAIPEVLETRVLKERIATIERRLPGTPLLHLLLHTEASQVRLRASWIRAYLQAAAELCRLELEGQGFGDVCHSEPIRTSNFCAYLEQSASRSLSLAGSALSMIDPKSLAAAWPEPEQPAFVHLDVYPGNV
jgi:hypothetical protein